MKNIIVFDLDGTLAESKASIDAEMANLLTSLLATVRVAIISGGDWPQFETQVLAHLPAGDVLERLSILPTCGTKFFEYKNGWQKLYAEDFNPAQKQQIIGAIDVAVTTSGFKAEKTWGDAIEDRGSQITYSALGQQAPLDAKKAWDPDMSKRKAIKALIDATLSAYSVNIGGSTSIDVTLPGIDKAYGIRKLRDITGLPIAAMLYVGDAIFPGGNDYPAKEAGCTCVAVRDPHETKRVIETIVACYAT